MVKPPPFPEWVKQLKPEISVQDALGRYISDYGIQDRDEDIPEDLAILRAETRLLNLWIEELGDSAPAELRSLVSRFNIDLVMRERSKGMHKQKSELDKKIAGLESRRKES